MINNNHLNKTILFVTLITINELQADQVLRKGPLVIQQLEITKTEEIEQWNQWPSGQNRSNLTIPKCTQKERTEG